MTTAFFRKLAAWITAVCLMTVISAAAMAETMLLPMELLEIGEEAFYADTSLDDVILPDGVVSIGSRAFADSSVNIITVPASVTEIAEDAFSGCNVTFICHADTTAAEYAEKHENIALQIDDGITEITLWTYPIGMWADASGVENLLQDFYALHPDILVKVECLNYMNGDDRVNTAIVTGEVPDIIMEGPERLVANWGVKGAMVDVSDCIPANTYASAVAACTASNGAVYEVPVCMMTHCMAINRDVFAAAGALQYLDESTHTWNSVDSFFKAVQAVYDAGYENVGSVYCGGQGGDQGTRALITNLGGGSFANAQHTAYTFASAGNAAALSRLYAQNGIVFDAAIFGGDEISLFTRGKLQMAFCWNYAQGNNYSRQTGFHILPMAFPSDTGARLEGGVWGFGILDSADEARIEAAKTFIRFMTADDMQYAKAVALSNYMPVRDITGFTANPNLLEYASMSHMFGSYYQMTPNWSKARAAWWQMLQQVGSSDGTADTILGIMYAAQNSANA